MTTLRELCAQITDALPDVRAAEAADPSQVFVTVVDSVGELRRIKPGEIVRGYTSSTSNCVTQDPDGQVPQNTTFYRTAVAVLAEVARRRAMAPTPTPPAPGQPTIPQAPRVAIPQRRPGLHPVLGLGLGAGLGLAVAWLWWG